MTLGAALAAEKQHIIDHIGVLTQSQLEELNERAQRISEKHNFYVAFLLDERDYGDESMYSFMKACYRENIGLENEGFMPAWNKEIRVWLVYTTSFKANRIVMKTTEDQFWKVFQTNTNEKSYYDGVSAFLDAADLHLTKVKAKSLLANTIKADKILYEFVGNIFMILTLLFIVMTILSKVWSIRKEKFVSIRVQKWRNNYRTVTMLALFPCIVFFLSYITAILFRVIKFKDEDTNYMDTSIIELNGVIIGFVLCIAWLVIAYYYHEKMINAATGAKPLERRENKRVYNLVENLCMAINMDMPKINIIEDGSLNAFASGINKETYTITLSRGLTDKLDDTELEAVIAHELSHIKNNDAQVMIVSIIFVGIFTFLGQATILALLSKFIWRSKQLYLAIGMIMFGLFVIIPGYFITLLMRSSISCNREYMADAGSAEMTRNPLALAAALRKISADPYIEAVKRKDVAQLFIDNPREKKDKSKKGLFATHPPIEKRIKILEQF